MVIGLNIIEEEKEDIVTLRVAGRIDATSSPALEKKISELIQTGHKKILIDFTKVDYLSSAGLRLMLSSTKKIKAQGGRLVFSGMSTGVMEIIKMAGFERILDIHSTEKDAWNVLKT
ncbi:MAG TPA: STAS domain-containing protein [Rhabdochlamydiaceae bacterium]|nr:STAS domain-containing protein [Rhabdochlamydiaceae bacterium]